MAKPKTPLLSLGARGSIGDTLTFQKRGRLTIARQKPIPTDPQTDLQLAQRQVYRDAVDAWRALTPEEKDAWRGVCPGLTAYQCFMRSELKYVEPTPPPEEHIEQQAESNTAWPIDQAQRQRAGQKLIISNRRVTKLAFYIYKDAGISGDVPFGIRKVSDDSLIASKVWGDAADLPTVATLEEVEFDTPVLINEEVRIYCQFEGGAYNQGVRFRLQASDVKGNECYTQFIDPDWSEIGSYDAAYRYKYYLP